MTVWKPYLLMTLLVAIVVTVATSYIDVIIQEERDQRWAVSGIISIVPEDGRSWRFHLFGYQFRVQPEEIAEQFQLWLHEKAQDIIGMLN